MLRAPLGFGVRLLAARQRDDERRDERVDPASQRRIELVEERLVDGHDVSVAAALEKLVRGVSAASPTEPIARVATPASR